MTRRYHPAQGDPCAKCGGPASEHPTPEQVAKRAGRDRGRVEHNNRPRPGRKQHQPGRKRPSYYVGVDGEGHDVCAACRRLWVEGQAACACGCADADHAYVYLAAVAEDGTVKAESRYAPEGLTHEECARVLLTVPRHAICFAFMFSYDVTKITAEMPREFLYYLMRPELRRRFVCSPQKGGCGKVWMNHRKTGCPKCGRADTRRQWTQKVRWNGRGYDFFAGSLTVSEGFERGPARDRCKKCDRLAGRCDCGAPTYAKRSGTWKKTAKVWDVFKYFQSSFVSALKSWQIGTPEQVKRIDDMKQRRGLFQNEEPERVMAYCREECRLLAQMMRVLLEDCEGAGVKQDRGYFGAGSIASKLLKNNNVSEYRSDERTWSPELRTAIMSAYFGGRFENSRLGIVREPIWGDDINSAYPYALTFLPCLAHGKWTGYRHRPSVETLRGATLALCHFRVREMTLEERKTRAWLPLPHRDDKGSISYPSGFMGWAWREEVLASVAGWPDDVEILGAYLFHAGCDHRPFGFMPDAYRKRYEWGSGGKGLVMKGGINASYGKTAQRVGDDPKFRDWVWAGNCTSRTRAQILEAISSAKDPWNVLAVATDGIYSTEKLALTKPLDTGTGDLKKALGGWDSKESPEGAFFAKPGLYWRLNLEKPEDIRARGLGRREAYKSKTMLEDGWLAWDRRDYKYEVPVSSRRFYGAKTSLYGHASCACGRTWAGGIETGCPACGSIGQGWEVKETKGEHGEDLRGKWRERTFGVGFDPHPKRERMLEQGGESVRLVVRDISGGASWAYGGQTSPEGQAARAITEEELEQPEGDVGGIEDEG